MSRIYVCGPMRGHPEHNFPAFERAAAELRAMGFVVVSPVDVGRMFANDPDVHGSEYLREDLLHLARCQAIALLPGWETSVGARCEVGVALTLGLPFYGASQPREGRPFKWARIPAPSRVVIAGGYELPPGAVDTLDSLRDEVNLWQRDTFLERTPSSIAAHLVKEARELQKAPDDLEEMADVALLLFGLADGLDLVGAIRAKLEKNKRRTWGEPDAAGVVEHVAEGDA